ncbi:MAG: hypothetical protein RBR66_03755 [Candidatus Izemoplasmatales bacterium]|nr:hypothetical protein [Candidatus Izemoplasmatales bacterium]
MKKRFMLSLSALIASVFLFIVTTFAWFVLVTQNNINNLPGQLSGIVYDLGGDFVTNSVIYPELELINEDIYIINYSQNTDLYLRLKIEYTKINLTYNSLTYTYTASSPVQKTYTDVPNDEHLIVDMNAYFFYDADGYWYYDLSLENEALNTLITSLKYDGFKASNEYALEDIIINITLEVTTEEEGIWSPITTMVFIGRM